jgi:hypothetical protein
MSFQDIIRLFLEIPSLNLLVSILHSLFFLRNLKILPIFDIGQARKRRKYDFRFSGWKEAVTYNVSGLLRRRAAK